MHLFTRRCAQFCSHLAHHESFVDALAFQRISHRRQREALPAGVSANFLIPASVTSERGFQVRVTGGDGFAESGVSHARVYARTGDTVYSANPSPPVTRHKKARDLRA
jgi:hypothetical protein